MTEWNVSEFLTIVKGRRELGLHLLELSRRQTDLIGGEDYAGLLQILGEKQHILGRLDKFDKQNPNLRRQWHDNRPMLDATTRDDCEHILAEIEATLAEVLKLEKESTDHMVERRDTTRRQLQAISQGTQHNKAYRDSLAPATHRYLDVGQ